jgi:predicted ester cyclase
MAEPHTVATVRRAVAALNAGDVAGYIAHFTDDCPRWSPGVDEPAPLSLIRESSEMLLVALDGFWLEELQLFGIAEFVCAHWKLQGKHTGEYFGFPPTQNDVSIENIELYQFESNAGGLICSTWTFGDTADFMNQLGISPSET